MNFTAAIHRRHPPLKNQLWLTDGGVGNDEQRALKMYRNTISGWQPPPPPQLDIQKHFSQPRYARAPAYAQQPHHPAPPSLVLWKV